MGHSTDEMAGDRSRRSGGVIPAVHLIAWGLLCGWLLFGVRRYIDVLSDFGVEVSSTSLLALELATAATVFWPVVLAGLVGVAFISYVIDDGLARAGSVMFRSLWLIAGVAVPVVVTITTYLALESDLGALIDSVS